MSESTALNNRLKPVRDVTRSIRALDRHCEAVLVGAAQLTIDMVTAREACGLSLETSQEAFERVGRIFAVGIEGRACSAGVHSSLADLARSAHTPVAWGDDCPGTGVQQQTEAPSRLRVVG